MAATTPAMAATTSTRNGTSSTTAIVAKSTRSPSKTAKPMCYSTSNAYITFKIFIKFLGKSGSDLMFGHGFNKCRILLGLTGVP